MDRLVVVIALAALLACDAKAPPAGASADTSAAPIADGPPLPRVTDDASSLLFSFVDAQGRVQTVPQAQAVPEAVRARVLVVDLARSPEERQAHKYAIFADLTRKDADGAYTVVVVSRYDGATQQAGAPALPPSDGSVVVYSAVWCGYCKKAKAWLDAKGVPYIERDVEKTPGAQRELTAKLKAAGLPGGGVPVIDWAGELVVGFDVDALARLLAAKSPAPAAPGRE